MQRFLALGAATLFLGVAARSATSYSNYRNARFGYSVLYPANLMTPRPESPNGDGRIFKSGDGRATLTVWGEKNVFNRSLEEQMNTARRDWAKDKGRVTYWKMGSGYYVLSGLTGREIFYEKTVPVRGGFATILMPSLARHGRLGGAAIFHKAQFRASCLRGQRMRDRRMRVQQRHRAWHWNWMLQMPARVVIKFCCVLCLRLETGGNFSR
jgi:hypothetical protein